MSSSRFDNIIEAEPDLVFSVSIACANDQFEKKVDLVIGAYRDDQGLPVVFDAVRLAGERIYSKPGLYNKEYLPMGGLPAFKNAAFDLVFGEVISKDLVATAQTLSGTGALSCVGHFLRRVMPLETEVYVSDPTWPNHISIFEELLGFKVKRYRYWDAEKVSMNIDNMLLDLEAAPIGSIIILHACAHNPTGEDPDLNGWWRILEVVKRKKHFPVVDCAYQGFATSDMKRDAAAVHLFAENEIEFAVCQSFAKNMGLYGERVGAVHVVCKSEPESRRVLARLNRSCRVLWSNPPKHGAEIATQILTDPQLRRMWLTQLQEVSERISEMRSALRNSLEERNTPGDWSHITKQIGMFSFTGLTTQQVIHLRNKYHIYMMANGRMSIVSRLVNQSLSPNSARP